MTRTAPFGLRSLFTALLLAALAAAATAQSPAPSFSKSFSPATLGPGSVSTLRFDVGNSSSLPATSLAFTDNLPAGVTIADPPNASSSCGGTLDAPAGGGTVSFADGGVGAAASCSISVNVTSATPGTHTNVSGNLTSSAGNSGSATADLTVATDRPGFTKSFSPSSVFFNDRSTLTFTIDNTANSAAAVNLRFSDNLPLGMVVAGPSNAATTCGGGIVTAAAGSSVISYGPQSFNDAAVAAGASCTVSVDVLAGAVGALGNTSGELTSTLLNSGATRSSGKAGATLTVTVQQISLTKRFTDDPAVPGGTVTLEFTIRNLDRRSDATGISFTDDLGAVLPGLAATGLPAGGVCGSGSQLTGTGVLALTGGNLLAEESCTFSVTLQVPAGAAGGTFTNTTSAITADVGGSPVTGAPASDQLVVTAAPILTKTFVGDPVGAGESIVLEFTITNTNPTSAATDIAFSDVFVEVLPTASAIPADGFCGDGSTADYTPLIDNSSGGSRPATLVVSGASLGAGESCTFSVTLDVAVGAATNTYDNTTSAITATLDGETVTGNPASDSFDMVAGPTLLKAFTDDPAVPGGTVTLEFTLSLDERAPGDATDVTFTDDLDAVLSGLVATGLPQSDVCGIGSQLSGTSTLLLTGGFLAPGESCTFSVTLSVPADATAGNHANTTSAVSATVLDVATMSNPAAADLRIAGLTLTKEFLDDPVRPGETVTLRFTVENTSSVATASDIFLQDDLRTSISGLTATGLPQSDVCGVGSVLTAVSGNRVLVLDNGVLAPGASCTFDVTLQVPSGTVPDTYINTTSAFSALIDGTLVIFDNATDTITVANDFLALTKEFTNDPALPGGTVNLRFTLTNLDGAQPAANVAFTDDLGAALEGLAAIGLPAAACGGTVSGTDVVSFSGGALAAGEVCVFDVAVAVPADVQLGTLALNTTSQVTGTIGGLGVVGDPASDLLQIDFLAFSKAFGGEATVGGTVELSFAIENLSADTALVELSFSDDLGFLPGLTAIGLPAFDVCGEGSVFQGTSFLTLSGANLLPGGSCTFSVTLQVPADAEAGSYENVTSDLLQFGASAADPATATLVVIEVVDADGDGILDANDVCPGTVIPESVPTRRLGVNRFALVDGDTTFDTTLPNGNGPGASFTVADTGGCSCEQIIDELGLGNGHTFFGCSLSAMRDWVTLIASSPSGGASAICGLHLLDPETPRLEALLEHLACFESRADAKAGAK